MSHLLAARWQLGTWLLVASVPTPTRPVTESLDLAQRLLLEGLAEKDPKTFRLPVLSWSFRVLAGVPDLDPEISVICLEAPTRNPDFGTPHA